MKWMEGSMSRGYFRQSAAPYAPSPDGNDVGRRLSRRPGPFRHPASRRFFQSSFVSLSGGGRLRSRRSTVLPNTGTKGRRGHLRTTDGPWFVPGPAGCSVHRTRHSFSSSNPADRKRRSSHPPALQYALTPARRDDSSHPVNRRRSAAGPGTARNPTRCHVRFENLVDSPDVAVPTVGTDEGGVQGHWLRVSDAVLLWSYHCSR